MSQPTDRIQTIGINDIYEYNVWHGDSTQRSGGTNNKPSFTLSPSIPNILGAKLMSAQIPFTYYVINESNNVFYYEDTHADASVHYHRITLTPGHYNAEELAANLQNRLRASTIRLGILVTYDHSLNKLVIQDPTLEAGQSRPFALIFRDDPFDPSHTFDHHLGPYLGFNSGRTPSEDLGSEGSRLIAPNALLITGPNYLYITTSFAGRLSNSIRVNSSIRNERPIFAKIPVTVNPGGIILFHDTSPTFYFDMALDQISHIELSLIFGDSGAEVDLNGAPWSVVFEFLTQRDTAVPRQALNGTPQPLGRKRARVK